jgi:hypothetical protein
MKVPTDKGAQVQTLPLGFSEPKESCDCRKGDLVLINSQIDLLQEPSFIVDYFGD